MICREEDFEKSWTDMIGKHRLEKQPYLTQIFEVRRKWAKPYFRDVFCAKMSSTQCSESANHVLKTYVPPGCPMHLFVEQYEKLQFDRTSEECYQEKRTSLSGIVLRANLPIERHASTVYTRTMFEQFGLSLFELGNYLLQEVEARKLYRVSHVNTSSCERWCQSVFNVSVNEADEQFNCECCFFQHAGMPCSHQLKVLNHLAYMEIPRSLILKRCTRDTRDILPPHLRMYQRDHGRPRAETYRHSNLSLTALEIVKMGDCDAEAYEMAMTEMVKVRAKLEPLCALKDGLGVEARQTNSGRDGLGLGVDNTPSGPLRNRGIDLPPKHGTAGEATLEMPSRKMPRGRPTNARVKAPYEKVSRRTRFCSVCRKPGHKCTTCPTRGDTPGPSRQSPRCPNCGVTGHRKNTCGNPMILLC